MHSNQSDYQKSQIVRQIVIEPMLRIYYAPAHLRDDETAYKETLIEYERALLGFSAKVLQTAWDLVKDEHKTWGWPHFQVIKDACKRCEPQYATRNSDADEQHPWTQKSENARAMAREYMQKFEHSPLMERAKIEKYQDKLRAYALNAAHAQASMISGCINFGYTNAVYAWDGMQLPKVINDRCTSCENFCRDRAKLGEIGIEVPNEAIEAWRQSA